MDIHLLTQQDFGVSADVWEEEGYLGGVKYIKL